jgi:hypothetical protein
LGNKNQFHKKGIEILRSRPTGSKGFIFSYERFGYQKTCVGRIEILSGKDA